MGNKLSCSCAPLMRKGYRYEDSPWQTSRRRDGHLLRLWAEVFHVAASGAGQVKWQQVSEDLVPVNITCIQDSPECVFHITAYNSQVDKILDVRLVQPGTRIGQASECFVYWKDPMTNDTWGLNFTSPIDAKQFRECCSPSFKFSRKASSSYSLKLEPPGKGKVKPKRKPLSTPASPSRAGREPQCTCMTAEQYARLKAQDPRYRGSSTLPRPTTKATDAEMLRSDKPVTTASTTSLYDNVTSSNQGQGQDTLQRQKSDTSTMTNICTASVGTQQNHVGLQISQDDASDKQTQREETSKSEGTQAGGTLQNQKTAVKTSISTGTGTRTKDYNENIMHEHQITSSKRSKSKSTEDMNVDAGTLKKMLKPLHGNESPVTSPEMGRRRYNYYNASTNTAPHGHQHIIHNSHFNNNSMSRQSSQSSRFSGSRSSHEIGRGGYQPPRGLYLELEKERCGLEGSPPSDNVMFDNQCYATTPSSSNGNSDQDQPGYGPPQGRSGGRHSHHPHQQQTNVTPTPGSPTSRLLLEYEMHLRNTLAKGMDAESYSLHTFEALLSQSMENLGSSSSAKSSTLPLPHRLNVEHSYIPKERERDGYYSDRNELMRERERERGYLSDHNSSYSNSRCASCIGESARAQWFRHSDGWRSGSSTLGSGTNLISQSTTGHRRSPWDSLPSLKQDGSLNDSGYKSNRADSFEQRGVFDRQDSLRSDYLSDRETRYGIVQQASIDSTDSRLCYLTSSEISDDDRMSLTTAISDEDDGESIMASPYKAKATGTAAASFNCTGAVRKAGFLSVKKWLLRKKHQIELARKRGWKGYWVCLKGTTLLFYPCDSREGRSVEAAPKHLIIVDGAIMQPIPEHPKRDYIFCLSTAFGDAYLFQAPCQVELENWVNSIHSACAAAFARHRGKTGTLHLLQEEIFRLDKAIESDHKLKHMADLQSSVVTDQDTRVQIQQQIITWEENLERLHCEQFRLRCYMASLQCGELPNPKSLLTHVSRPTKNTLNKLGVFTVSSFHAFICARSPSLLNNLLAGRGATKRRPPLLSRSNSGSSRRSMQMSSRDDSEKSYNVPLPDNSYVTVYLRDSMTVEEFLASACVRKNLNPMEHFVRVKKRREMEDHNYFVPHRNDLIETYLHTHEIVEVCAKILYQVELQRSTLEQMWGFSVEAELIENADRQDELCCYVSRVEDKSVALQNGIIKGDEIIVINGAIVSDLDMMYLESVLQEEQALCMMMRSSRVEPPDLAGILRSTDDIIESLVCPPPPSDAVMSEEMISGLIVPAPSWSKHSHANLTKFLPNNSNFLLITERPGMEHHDSVTSDQQLIAESGRQKAQSRTSSFEIENLLKTAEQVTTYCRSPQETRKSSPTGSVTSSASNAVLTPSRQLTDAEKLRKVILELVDTERAYVKHLNNLLEYYLEPLKRETFLSNAEITALFGNIQEIVTFQRQFLQNLEEALEIEPDFHKFEHSSHFRNVLFAIGSAFLYYVNHFKLYSSFCASHSKAQKVLHPNEGNQALQEFLLSKNPKQEHSSTLESYLIKPIQRILKYPLLLQQLKNLTDPYAEEHQHLIEALKGMEKVAEHINEMQRIHEEYGAIFDHLFRQHQKSCKQPIDLSPDSIACLGDLLYYGGVEWLNISDFLGKIKKGLELHAMCFVFKSAVVFLCKERLRQKKKLMGVSNKNAPNEVEIIRYQVLIPVTEVQVRASSAKDMDSHFLWELIHLRSQLQRRSEKVYVLSNSTADFRNAFLKTIRQIIRESVRNMSIPIKERGSISSVSSAGQPHFSGNSQTLERPKQTSNLQQGSQTLGKPKKKNNNNQRHSSGNIDYDNLHGSSQEQEYCIEQDEAPPVFRIRSKTVGDDGPPPVPKRTTSELTTEKDPGVKSEGEDESLIAHRSKSLGRTPNHLTLSTTSTLSVGSTGSQARLIQSSHAPSHYQPILMKDLGKTSSTDSGESISFHTEKSSDSTSGVDVNDDNYQLTDEIVDKQLDDLKRECLSYETRDVAKFMEKLKTQSESIDGGDGSQDEKKADIVMLEKKSTRRESESKKEMEMIAKQKELRSESLEKRKGSESSNHVQVRSQRKSSPSPTTRKPKTIDMDTLSPKPQDVDISQVQIIKIKSPGGSRKSSRETSRNNSIERSPSKERQQQTLKKPEGGILKKPSPKFGKASEYKLSNSLRPDSFISPFSSFESKSDKLSPSSEILPAICSHKDTQKRASFSDYERDPQDYHHQAMKSRSLEGSLEHLKSALKHQSSYEQYGSSPVPNSVNDSHKYYSLSAQHSIESNRSPVRYCSPIPPQYYNEPFYEYPRQKIQKRESRSLERPDFSRQSSSEYERYYEEPPYPQHYSQQQQQKNHKEHEDQQRHRRHSVYEHRSIPYHYYSMSPDDYLMSSSSHYEQPSACVDCYYQTYRQPSHSHYIQQPPPLPQRNPSTSSSQQQHHQQPQQSKSPSQSQSRQRQSRSRKKLSRRMSSNYFNKSFDDDDTQNASTNKQSPDNEEIRV
ncbi:protein still life, isoform SIF type 1 isoform X7 [Chironomus tepperi]|uniref:protein still life, isoform SIF type 1 isoform X7 n=1 Tax=Chironomus tepperi TaxID=113505 RepID=UPI00391FBE11